MEIAPHMLTVRCASILAGLHHQYVPVQQATKVELIINLKTSQAIGLTVPER
jgi:ABC-type uncharacterized transport system substrate-binding protein